MKRKFYIWEGSFKNFKDVRLKKNGIGFNGKYHLNNIKKEYEQIDKQVKQNKKISIKLTNRIKFLLPSIKKILKEKNKIKILDFGGGYGLAFFYLKQELRKDIEKIEFDLVDMPKITNIIKNKNCKFNIFNEIKKKNYDLIFTSSCIQYIPKWKLIIKAFCKLKPNNLLFLDLFAGNIKNFVSIQNYYDSKIPQWFLNYDNFILELKKNNYQIKKKIINQSYRLNKKCFLDMNNFNKKLRLKHTLDVLFTRNEFR